MDVGSDLIVLGGVGVLVLEPYNASLNKHFDTSVPQAYLHTHTLTLTSFHTVSLCLPFVQERERWRKKNILFLFS